MAHSLALEVMERERAGPQKGLVPVQGGTAAGLGKPGEENHLGSSCLDCRHHLLLSSFILILLCAEGFFVLFCSQHLGLEFWFICRAQGGEKGQEGPLKICLTRGWAATKDTGTSGDWSFQGGQEPCGQPDCKASSATSTDVLRAHLDTLCFGTASVHR